MNCSVRAHSNKGTCHSVYLCGFKYSILCMLCHTAEMSSWSYLVSLILHCMSSVFWEGNLRVPPLMRSNVKERIISPSLCLLVFSFRCSEMMKHLFCQLLKFSERMLWNCGENSYVSLCWLTSTLCFCYFRFVVCDPFSSFHWAHHVAVWALLLLLGASWWMCPHSAHQVCQVKSCKLPPLFSWKLQHYY